LSKKHPENQLTLNVYSSTLSHLLNVSLLALLVISPLAIPKMVHAWGRENKVTIGFSSGFGIDARFDSPAMPSANPGGDILRIYDNGHVDTTNVIDGAWTRDWSMLSDSQFDAGAGTIAFEKIRPAFNNPDSIFSDPDDIQGFHIGFRKESRSSDNLSLGFNLAFDYQSLDSNSQSTQSTTIEQFIQTYEVGPPVPATAGDLGGSQLSTLYTQTGPIQTTGNYHSTSLLEAEFLLFRIGMDAAIRVNDRNNLLLGLGVVYSPIKYEFSFSESLQVTPTDPVQVFNRGQKDGWDHLFGAYIQLGWEFELKEYLRAYVNARHIHSDPWKLEYSADRTVELNFRNSYFIDSGISFLW
jgi:hypothetical protein